MSVCPSVYLFACMGSMGAAKQFCGCTGKHNEATLRPFLHIYVYIYIENV